MWLLDKQGTTRSSIVALRSLRTSNHHRSQGLRAGIRRALGSRRIIPECNRGRISGRRERRFVRLSGGRKRRYLEREEHPREVTRG